jgi:hypothetical protein
MKAELNKKDIKINSLENKLRKYMDKNDKSASLSNSFDITLPLAQSRSHEFVR